MGTTGVLRYVAIGDSAAQGIGASRPDRSYVGVLADDIHAATGRSVRVINLSISGATVDVATLLERHRPTVVWTERLLANTAGRPVSYAAEQARSAGVPRPGR